MGERIKMFLPSPLLHPTQLSQETFRAVKATKIKLDFAFFITYDNLNMILLKKNLTDESMAISFKAGQQIQKTFHYLELEFSFIWCIFIS